MTETFGEGNMFWLLRNDFWNQPQAVYSGKSICKNLNALAKFIVSASNKINPEGNSDDTWSIWKLQTKWELSLNNKISR